MNKGDQMKVLVIGRGGREHSIVMHLKQSNQVDLIYAAPGNGGMEKDAICVPIEEMNISSLIQFVKEKDIDLTIVGPENPLNAGIANEFTKHGLRIFAPTQEAALLEGSKAFAKKFMMTYDIPTAAYETFTNPEEAKAYIRKKSGPIVVREIGRAHI